MSVARRVVLCAGLLASTACEQAAPPLDLRSFVPSTVGDRARFVGDDGHRSHVGLTARTANGLLVQHGTDRTAPTFLRVSAERVDVVDPTGAAVMPLLLRPTADAAVAYRLPDGSACSLEVELAAPPASGPAAASNPNAPRCLATTRRCALEPGGGLPRRTRTEEHELHCPIVGLVERSFRADPPLPFEGVRSATHERLESAHVRGFPRPSPEVPLGARVVVLPSDVAAACGATPVASTLGADGALATFTLADGTLRIVQVPVDPADPLVVPDGRGAALRIEAPPSCSAGAARLVPLLRSMM